MKYGETLRQRSVPQWAYQNVDYDSIKNLIKDHTTPGKGKAISIPGHQDDTEASFESLLFTIFVEQHDCVGLFVKSKSGEIQRRLDHLERQLRNLQVGRWPPSVIPDRLPPSRLAKYARIEQQAIDAGEEIKSLSRFIGAQRLALTKLLKKYKKWTGSEYLELRFKNEVLSQPESFTKLDLGPHLDHWKDVLQDIRQAMEVGLVDRSGNNSNSGSPLIRATVSRNVESSAAIAQRITDVISSGSDVDFDSVLASTPLGNHGARAVYWIHPEQLVELQVLLLQHTRLSVPRNTPSVSSSGPNSPTITRRSSSSRRDSSTEPISDTGVIILDNVDEFAQVQSSTPLSDSEDSYGRLQPAATIRWNLTDDVAISIRDDLKGSEGGKTKPPAKIRSKYLGAFLDVDNEYTPWRVPGTETPEPTTTAGDSQKVDDARNWLASHRQVHPLVGLLSKRTRFINLPTGRGSGQWCALDSDIFMRKLSAGDFAGKAWPFAVHRDTIPFPYAVLEVRQEGKYSTDLIQILDESHLTERVRGFSLAAHSIWTCCRPPSMTPPFWLPVLSKDIRKVPRTKSVRRTRKGTISPTQKAPVSKPGTSTDTDDLATSSTAVGTGADSSATSLPTTPLESRNFKTQPARTVRYALEHPAAGQPRKAQPPTRYWSEYDHPEDGSDGENGYFIYVDPNEDMSWVPFRGTTTKIYNGIKSWFSPTSPDERKDVESEPLLQRPEILPASDHLLEGSIDDTDDTDDTTSSSSSSDNQGSVAVLRRHLNYGTLRSSTAIYDPSTAPAEDTITVLLTSSLSLFFAVTLSLVLLVLSATGRHKARGEIDVVIVFGIIISLLFGTGGFWGLVRGSAQTLTRWAVGGLVFASVVLVNGLLVGWVIVQLREMDVSLNEAVGVPTP